MKKRIIVIVFAVIIAVFTSACNFFPVGNESLGDSEIFIVKDGKITGLTSYGKTLKKITIPDEIDGVPITSIGRHAFEKTRVYYGPMEDSIGVDVEEVVLGSNVVEIASGAFYNTPHLKKVTFNDALVSIGSHAFYRCKSLEEVVHP